MVLNVSVQALSWFALWGTALYSAVREKKAGQIC